MAPYKALVVDDQAELRAMLKFAVERQFPYLTVVEAEDGEDAILKLDEDCRLVLSDWKMPHLSGYELLNWLKQSSRFKDIPFVMISSVGDEDSIEKAKEAGTSAYLIKPWSKKVLFTTIEPFVGNLNRRVSERFRIQGAVNIYENDLLSGNAIDISVNGLLGEFNTETPGLPNLNATVAIGVSTSKGESLERVKGVVRRIVKIKDKHAQIAFQFMHPQLALPFCNAYSAARS
jgi:CheY-like chemotaxis protein